MRRPRSGLLILKIEHPSRNSNVLKVYLKSLTTSRRRLLLDKLECSQIFESKLSYPTTISHIYRGDYLNMKQNSKFSEILQKQGTNVDNILFCDMVQKINRRKCLGNIHRLCVIVYDSL